MHISSQILRASMAASAFAFASASLALGANDTTLRRGPLEWTRADSGHDITWPDAQRFCRDLGRNWRLPTVDELSSIYSPEEAVGVRCGTDRCRVPRQFDLTGPWFWSADPVGSDGSDGAELAWGVLLVNGAHTKSVKTLADGGRALCVRQSAKGEGTARVDASPTVPLAIDPSHTAVIFSWSHRGLSHPAARLEQLSGTLLLNREDLGKSSVEVTFPVEGLRTGNDALDHRLHGPDFFDAPRYPTITFRSTHVSPVPATNQLTVVGDLTAHGVTQSVTLHATINQIQLESANSAAAGFDAEGVLRRSDFGLGRYVPLVGDDVAIHITFEAHTAE
jgi:polyisoprenoid-binding protein YceI